MSVDTDYTQAERLSLSLELNQPRIKREPSIILLVTLYWNIYYFYEIYLPITKNIAHFREQYIELWLKYF